MAMAFLKGWAFTGVLGVGVLGLCFVVYLQHDTLEGYKKSLDTVQKEAAREKAGREAAEGKLQDYVTLEADYAKWKAKEAARLRKEKADLAATMAGSTCAVDTVPPAALRMQREKAAAVRARAGVSALGQ